MRQHNTIDLRKCLARQLVHASKISSVADMAASKRKSTSDADTETSSKKPKNSSSKAQSISILREEEPAFPRGGASVLTPLEHKQIQIQATRDVLFEQNTGKRHTGLDSGDEENGGGETGEPNATMSSVPGKPRFKVKNKKSGMTLKEPRMRIESLGYKVGLGPMFSRGFTKVTLYSVW